MAAGKHIIRRQIMEFQLAEQSKAQALQQRISVLCRDMLREITDRVCSELLPQDYTLRLQTLDLDLGGIAWNDLDFEVPRRFEEKLREELQKQVPRHTTASTSGNSSGLPPEDASPLALIKTFLRQGYRPWWAASDSPDFARIFAREWQHNRAALITLLMPLLQVETALQRLILQVPGQQLQELISACCHQHATTLLRCHEEGSAWLSHCGLSGNRSRLIAWQATFQTCLRKESSPERLREQYCASLLSHISKDQLLSTAEQLITRLWQAASSNFDHSNTAKHPALRALALAIFRHKQLSPGFRQQLMPLSVIQTLSLIEDIELVQKRRQQGKGPHRMPDTEDLSTGSGLSPKGKSAAEKEKAASKAGDKEKTQEGLSPKDTASATTTQAKPGKVATEQTGEPEAQEGREGLSPKGKAAASTPDTKSGKAADAADSDREGEGATGQLSPKGKKTGKQADTTNDPAAARPEAKNETAQAAGAAGNSSEAEAPTAQAAGSTGADASSPTDTAESKGKKASEASAKDRPAVEPNRESPGSRSKEAAAEARPESAQAGEKSPAGPPDSKLARERMQYPLPKHTPIPWTRVKLEGELIQNAGLVLLWPYLSPFFDSLGLLEVAEQPEQGTVAALLGKNKKVFASEEAAWRGVHLSQYLVTGLLDTPEEELLLNKLLCGLPLHLPVPRQSELSSYEEEECMILLHDVIANWTALRKASPDTLRASFLCREGLLSEIHRGYSLQITRNTFDILLDRLPWSYSLVALPWMEQMIHVEW